MIITICIAVALGILNSFLANSILFKQISGSSGVFLYSWVLAFLYKLVFLAVCFFVFYKFKLPYAIIFFIILILVQVTGQIILAKRKLHGTG